MIDLALRVFVIDQVIVTPVWWNADDRRSAYWRWYVNAEDGASLVVAGERIAMPPDTVYLVPAGTAFGTHCHRTVQHTYLHFGIFGMPEIVVRDLFPGPIAVPNSASLCRHTQALLAAVPREQRDDLPAQCRAKALLYDGFARVLGNMPQELRTRYDRLTTQLAPVYPALRYIEEQYAAPITNVELAEQCCVSTEYFVRLFHQCTGDSPRRYLTNHRLNIAANRLVFTADSVDEIAVAVGFGNRAYFTRVFSRALGAPPATYRRIMRDKEHGLATDTIARS